MRVECENQWKLLCREPTKKSKSVKHGRNLKAKDKNSQKKYIKKKKKKKTQKGAWLPEEVWTGPVATVRATAGRRPPSAWLQSFLWGWWCSPAAAAEASDSGELAARRELGGCGARRQLGPVDLESSRLVVSDENRFYSRRGALLCPTQQHIKEPGVKVAASSRVLAHADCWARCCPSDGGGAGLEIGHQWLQQYLERRINRQWWN